MLHVACYPRKVCHLLDRARHSISPVVVYVPTPTGIQKARPNIFITTKNDPVVIPAPPLLTNCVHPRAPRCEVTRAEPRERRLICVPRRICNETSPLFVSLRICNNPIGYHNMPISRNVPNQSPVQRQIRTPYPPKLLPPLNTHSRQCPIKEVYIIFNDRPLPVCAFAVKYPAPYSIHTCQPTLTRFERIFAPLIFVELL